MASAAGGEPSFSAKDYIAAASNSSLKATLQKCRSDPKNEKDGYSEDEEVVLFADNLIKINRYGKRQTRALVITSIAVLNCKPKSFGDFKRRIPICMIEEIWAVRGTLSIVLHMWEVSGEYDYRFEAGSAPRRDEIVAALQHAYQLLMAKPLPVRDMDAKAAEGGMLTKPAVKERAKSLDPATVRTALETRRSIISTVATQRVASRRHLGSAVGSTGGLAAAAAAAGGLSGAFGGAGAADSLGSGAAASGSALSAAAPGGGPDAGSGSGSGSGSGAASGTAGAGAGAGPSDVASPALNRAKSAAALAAGGAAAGAASSTTAPGSDAVSGSAPTAASGGASAAAAGGAGAGAGAGASAGGRPSGVGAAAGSGPGSGPSPGAPGLPSMSQGAPGMPPSSRKLARAAVSAEAQAAHVASTASAIVGVMSDAVAALGEVATARGGDGAALAQIVSKWAEAGAANSEALARAYTIAEAFLSPNAGDALYKGLSSDAARTKRVLAGVGDGVRFPGEAFVRGWSTRSLWKLLALIRQAASTIPALHEEVKVAGGFEGYVLKGFSVPPAASGSARTLGALSPLVTRLERAVYVAMMEIIVDTMVRPADAPEPTAVETFGKAIVRPEPIKLIFRLLPTADFEVKLAVMKDMNALLLQKPEVNYPRILEQPEWMSWYAPLLAGLPRRQSDRDATATEFLKYATNFFVMLFTRVFSTAGATGDVERAFSRFMAQLRLQCGWGEAAVAVARNMIGSVAGKLASGVDRWHRKYDRPEWENLFKLATLVEDFIFYRPVAVPEDGGDMAELLAEQAGSTPMTVYMSTSLLHPCATMPLAPPTVEPVDRSTPGLHLNITTGEADDLKMAQRVLQIFTAVGLTGDAATDPAVARASDKKAKDLLVHANGVMKVLKEIVTFLEDCNKNRLLGDTTTGDGKARPASSRDPEKAEAALLENLAKFLEKRQKQQKTGFLSRSATKKGIVQALQTNVMRQRAQQTVRAQVQATLMAKATVTTVTVDDDEEEDDGAVTAVRVGTTAKRLQGTRAAVEATAASGAAGGAAAGAGAGAASAAAAAGGASSAGGAAAGGAGDGTLPAGLRAPVLSMMRTGAGGAGAGAAPGGVAAAAAAEAVKASIAGLDLDGEAAGAGAGAGAGSMAIPPPPALPPAAGGAGAGSADGSAAGGEAAAGEGEGEQSVSDLICDRCSQPLLDDDGVMALGSKFHVNCFTCCECDTPFRDAPYYERKGKAYCRADYLKKFGRSVCAGCMEPLKKGQRALEAGARVYHPEHFCCEGCGDVFSEDAQYYERENAPYCIKCNLTLFGMCAGCNQQITPDKPAVSAMSRNWHLACIKCAACGGGFDDGVFYTAEDEHGNSAPYCERDYLEMNAPRCRGCTDIIKDTGLHACGSSWHSQCFVCTVCSEGFPESNYFEVDGRPYCAKHYYENFGTKCAGCGDYIQDEVVNALNQQWHVGHFNCAKCSKPFADFEYYEKEGKAYDEPCYCELFCPVCPVCNCYVVEEGSVALGTVYHPWCLRCSHCGEQLTSVVHQSDDGKLYCDQDFMALVAYTCQKCAGLIEGESVSALGAHWHPECFTCSAEGCEVNLASEEDGGFQEVDGLPYCAQHHADMKLDKCARCGRGIILGTGLTVLKQNWHPACLVCGTCERSMTTADRIYPRDGKPTCEDCFMATADKCAGCGRGIVGKFLNVLSRKYHPDPGCLACLACGTHLTPAGGLFGRKGWPVCKDHAKGELAPEMEARFAEAEARAAAAAAGTAAARGGAGGQ